MSTSTYQERLDEIELQLNPKQWALKLVDEARAHPSGAEFIRSVAKGMCAEWPTVRPLHALTEQARQGYAAKEPEDIQAWRKSARQLRRDFWFLRRLFFSINASIESETKSLRLSAALMLSRLETLILRDAAGRTAERAATWIEQQGHTNSDQEHLSILSELAELSKKETSGTNAGGSGRRVRLPVAIECWTDRFRTLVVDAFAHKYAVLTIERKYFDRHQILCREVEAELEQTIAMCEDAAALFNEYLKIGFDLHRSKSERHRPGSESATSISQHDLTIDIEIIREIARDMLADVIATNWISEAKDRTRIDTLEEAGEYDAYITATLRKLVGTEPNPTQPDGLSAKGAAQGVMTNRNDQAALSSAPGSAAKDGAYGLEGKEVSHEQIT